MTGLDRAARRCAAAILLSLGLVAVAAAQTAPAKTAAAQAASPGDPIPVTYVAKAENPLNRFEIVSLGSFPIMLFYTGFFSDLALYIANFPDPIYLPWPMKNEKSYSATLTDSERVTRIGIALGASVLVGGVDAYLHAVKVKKAKRLREAAESVSP